MTGHGHSEIETPCDAHPRSHRSIILLLQGVLERPLCHASRYIIIIRPVISYSVDKGIRAKWNGCASLPYLVALIRNFLGKSKGGDSGVG